MSLDYGTLHIFTLAIEGVCSCKMFFTKYKITRQYNTIQIQIFTNVKISVLIYTFASLQHF
jgi:hypothetical protein